MSEQQFVNIDFSNGESYMVTLAIDGTITALEFHAETFGLWIEVDLKIFEAEEFTKLNAAVKLALAEQISDQAAL